MVAIVGSLVFAGAFAAVVGVFAFTLFPALPRITDERRNFHHVCCRDHG